MKIVSNKYKPIGWRGDSYRHYLASKGISSGRKQTYFAVQHFLKGNRTITTDDAGRSKFHRAFAKGHSVEDLEADSTLRAAFGIESSEVDAFKSRTRSDAQFLPEGFAGRSVKRVESSMPVVSERPLVVSDVPVVGGELASRSVVQSEPFTSQLPINVNDASGETVMTPGVPEMAPLTFSGGDNDI